MNTFRLVSLIALAVLIPATAVAQTVQSAPSQENAKRKRATTTVQAAAPQVEVSTTVAAPQVVTLLHQLSGLKMFRLLVRSGEVRTIARVDESFRMNGAVHTNIIAGLALDDGTI